MEYPLRTLAQGMPMQMPYSTGPAGGVILLPPSVRSRGSTGHRTSNRRQASCTRPKRCLAPQTHPAPGHTAQPWPHTTVAIQVGPPLTVHPGVARQSGQIKGAKTGAREALRRPHHGAAAHGKRAAEACPVQEHAA